ncbi:NUDIX domain-containing protein [Acidiphilium sp.]|uniref:NUDIX hydrolase n=1 Tax=Acidiphilium sp. TaxID=527 RepID=UPI003D083D17
MGEHNDQLSVAACLDIIAGCRNAVLPGDRLTLAIGGAPVGYVRPALGAALGGFATRTENGLVIDPRDAVHFNEVAHALAPQFGYRIRGEDFDVRSRVEGPVLAILDRGALPAFGVIGLGVHMNGYCRRRDGIYLWIARRSASKKLDPGTYDNLVGGGISAGMTPFETLVKEAAEEAAMPATIIAEAREVSRIAYSMERSEGLRRDVLVCYDLEVPDDFEPQPVDGEVESFQLVPLAAVPALVARKGAVKFNVNLVLIDFLLRHHAIADPDGVIKSALAAFHAG